jgi:hypothetical protein
VVEQPEAWGPGADAEDRVLRAFFDEDGRLSQLPARHAKRLVVLDRVVQSFEPGLKYTELEVNRVLGAWVAGRMDVVTVRRHLVDAGMLGREAGLYWRSGGTVHL